MVTYTCQGTWKKQEWKEKEDMTKLQIKACARPQPDPTSRKYFGTTQTIKLIYKEEGFGALYKGLLPKVMRLGPGTHLALSFGHTFPELFLFFPGGAIMLLVYDYVYEWLTAHT
ncbi:hypothetical protein ANCDUO_00073 [Ancylostoma duodenale]|uniref:Mitochondrial 2-oxodicarboxylate carrier n=1 Tax=Ancylostoma duodenale TaxID=51022 RepID=A0A0C2DHY6_9BILA|nr:hypothetical protein ANCDUO_00073 [Ancylostoma duodenale]